MAASGMRARADEREAPRRDSGCRPPDAPLTSNDIAGLPLTDKVWDKT